MRLDRGEGERILRTLWRPITRLSYTTCCTSRIGRSGPMMPPPGNLNRYTKRFRRSIARLRAALHPAAAGCRYGVGTRFYAESEVENLSGNRDLITIGENTHIRGRLLVWGHGGRISLATGVSLVAAAKSGP